MAGNNKSVVKKEGRIRSKNPVAEVVRRPIAGSPATHANPAVSSGLSGSSRLSRQSAEPNGAAASKNASNASQDSSKKNVFSSLKSSIMQQLNKTGDDNGKSERLKEGKIDMAYLKATIQDTLKENKPDVLKNAVFDRVPTGIDGFDETIEGGLIRNSIVLLGGGPGSGKSIFGMQYLVMGVEKCDEPGVYISFEEEPETILDDMRRFNWNLEKKMEDKKLAILYYSPEQVDRVIYVGGGPVREVIEDLKAKRVVIDSISAFTTLYKSDNEKRKALMTLFKTLKKWNCTTILISEQTLIEDSHLSIIEEYQSEGLIFLYHSKRGDVRERSIEIFKLRSTDHSTKINPVKISNQGITVYPDEQVY